MIWMSGWCERQRHMIWMSGVELDGGQPGPWARGGEAPVWVAAVVVVSENTTVAPASLFFFFKTSY